MRWTAPDGTARRERTEDPSQLVWELHRETQGPVPGLEVRRPTLEDTYLHMVHRDDGDDTDADAGTTGASGAGALDMNGAPDGEERAA